MLETIVTDLAELALGIDVVAIQPRERLGVGVGTERDGVDRVAPSAHALENTKEP